MCWKEDIKAPLGLQKETRHYEKKGFLLPALQLNYQVIEDISNSLYLYVMSANKQVA